jgi:hypothetical protein
MTARYLHCPSRDVTAITKKAIFSREPRGGSAEGALSCDGRCCSGGFVSGMAMVGGWSPACWIVPPGGYVITANARAAGKAARRAKAQARASDLAPVVKELQAAGFESLRAIAAGLDERGIPPARGGKWSATQVARLLGAAGIPFGGGVPGAVSVGAPSDASERRTSCVCRA